jgi:Response regulators consisting of a CheY-like receiver domain and a winged-helix DNA-binding domain
MSVELKKRILIVDDEKDITEILAYNISRQGYEADVAFDGESALSMALTGGYDLILLDVMLPKLDGFIVCTRIREKLDTPIIMLTAREEENDKITGLELGADDYMTKPFALGELFSRIKANIRRYSGETRIYPTPLVVPDTNTIKIGSLEINSDKYSVKKDGNEISLSKKEYELLEFLARNRGNKYQREELLQEVWGYEGFYGDIRTVDVTISRIRKKIEDNPSEPQYIQNKRGIGYYMA